MNHVAEEILSYYGIGSATLIHEGVSILDGAPGRGSGRFPLGSGGHPNQHPKTVAGRIDALRDAGASDADLVKILGVPNTASVNQLYSDSFARGRKADPTFYTKVKEMRESGMHDKEIVEKLNLKSTTELRTLYSLSTRAARQERYDKATEMLEKGATRAEVCEALNLPNESSLRSLLSESSATKTRLSQDVAKELKRLVDEKGMIDVGTGTELEMSTVMGTNISHEKMRQAIALLEEEGYKLYGGRIEQMTNPTRKTTLSILCPPGTKHREIFDAAESGKIDSIVNYIQREDEDGSVHLDSKWEYPASLDSSRLLVRLRDDVLPDGHTAVEKDGTIEIRRGCKDLDLGAGVNYAQVRILVDNDKYLKGMAYYSDDMPDGVDVIFNTNKTNAAKALKGIKHDDPLNPFNALLRAEGGQYHYIDDETGERKLGLINKTRQEGDWDAWADALPAQFLSKQSKQLITKQLNQTVADYKTELDEIISLTNPTIKRELLDKFAETADQAAVDLKAAALPRQKYQVILPVPSLAENEVYAPGYNNGETVALIRFPHAGTFEIPICRVNNKQAEGIKTIGPDTTDVIGINAQTAARLSGADFDGDTVMVIPCNSPDSDVHIISTPELEGLKGFDPKESYGYDDTWTTRGIDPKTGEETDIEHYARDGREFKPMSEKYKQIQMGVVTNLIADMQQIDGVEPAELAAAVRHSMVVIDAEKHKLDYRQSEIDNHIKELHEKYQRYYDEDGNLHVGSASTLITRAGHDVDVPKRKGQPRVDPETGELRYNLDEDRFWTDKKGKVHEKTQKSTEMAETNDAHTLSSGTWQDELYADFANAMKAMANQARLEMLHTPRLQYDANAKATYQEEVDNLNAQLNVALKNAPRERMAQIAAGSEIKALQDASDRKLTAKELKKLKHMALERARNLFGAVRQEINISARAWEAIQAGAISDSKLQQILQYADIDQVRSYAMPRQNKELSSAKQARIKAMRASHYTIAQIASALGVSRSTVQKYM